MAFSKAMYRQIEQCRKYLWLDTHRRDLRPDAEKPTPDDTVVSLAKAFFGPYTDAAVVTDGVRDLRATVERTKECMEQGIEVICGAAFTWEGLSCTVDILRREEGGYAIYMLKVASNYGAEEGGDHAYQLYVLEQCGVRVTGVRVLTLCKEYVRGEVLELSKLFRVHDRTELVRRELETFEDKMAEAESVLAGPEPVCDIGNHCFDSGRCPYWSHCSAHLPKPSVFDVYNIRDKKWTLYQEGRTALKDIPGALKLSPVQKIQIRYGDGDQGVFVDKEGVRDFLSTLFYPMHFFDFESMQPPVPPYPGTKPYTQIPFQYSLHYIDRPGGELKHEEFLDTSGNDPRRAIAERICRDIPTNACVIAYHMSYEEGRLKELAALFPDLAGHLLALVENLRDLEVPFKEGAYYHPAMGGSFSIKSVLPALFPDDPDLDYHRLEGVHNGNEVKTIFPKIRDMSPQEQERIRGSLLAYCKLDTLAMVKVWQKLCQAVEET